MELTIRVPGGGGKIIGQGDFEYNDGAGNKKSFSIPIPTQIDIDLSGDVALGISLQWGQNGGMPATPDVLNKATITNFFIEYS